MNGYITNASGERTAVILSIEEYEALVQIAEDVEDEHIAAESRAELRALRDRTGGSGTRSLDDVEAKIDRERSAGSIRAGSEGSS